MLQFTEEAQALPALRSELTLIKGAPTATGEATWLIHDPLQNRFIQIDRPAYEVFSYWADCRTIPELLAKVQAHGTIEIDQEDISGLVQFANRNKLTDQAGSGAWKSLLNEQQVRSRSPLEWAAHNYIFFRIPLVRPQRFLDRTLPTARLLGTPLAHAILVFMAFFGLYLTSRQWDAFGATFQHVFTWEGATLVGLAIVAVKIAHELGHAYCAAHYGCRVPTMGIAFMLMAPILYTDVTDAWRLTERRKRLMITAGGILVEFGIAAIALFAWAFIADGPMRSVAFTLAVVSLATSLFINLNPLMRFDGYYLLSDWLGIDNLQPRSFEITRWKLREWLFGFGLPCPEELSRRHRTIMVAYGWAVWIYRLALFIGIALIVYHFFFKVLGIALFLFEIGYFIARPIWGELKVWYKMKDAIRRSRRTYISAGTLATCLIAGLVPWSTRVEIPAILEPRKIARVYPAKPARVASIHVRQGQLVTAGTPLVSLESPHIERDIQLARTKLRLARMQHARRLANAPDREATLELESKIASLHSRIQGLKKEREEFITRAPITGTIKELNPALHIGRWLGAKHMIAMIASPKSMVVRGYVTEADLWRIEPGARGRFIPDALQRPSIDVTVDELGIGAASKIDIKDLASTFGGRIAVHPSEKTLVPVSAQYGVRMTVGSDLIRPELVSRGIAVISGRRESILASAWKNTIAVLLRESGF